MLRSSSPTLSWRWRLAAGVLGALLLALWAWATGWPSPITAADINQTLVNAAPVIPDGHTVLEQTFVPGRDGLVEVEILILRYAEATPPADASLTLEVRDDQGISLAAQTSRLSDLSHNQTLSLPVPRQPDSAGRVYHLIVRGFHNNAVTPWGHDHDVYRAGALRPVGANPVQDLRLVTRYQLSWRSALATLAQLSQTSWRVVALAVVFIPLPGALWLHLWPGPLRSWDRAARWGVMLALGAALWPLIWQWLTFTGGRWTPAALITLMAIGWMVVGVQHWRTRRTPTMGAGWRPAHAWLALILLVGLSVRWLAVRDLAFPPWVDASRHALITTILAEQGQMLNSYRPWLPVDRLEYHAGFHTLAAGLHLLLDDALPQLLLYLGQWLNGLVPLSVYTAAWLFTGRRRVGLAAAFLVALPFFFPGYYVSWGRLTQLTGMVILPVLAGVSWRLGTSVRGWRGQSALIALIAALAAGLFLVHIRVLLLYLPLALLIWLWRRGRGTGAWLAAGGLTLGLIAPRLFQLAPLAQPDQVFTSVAGYNDFPIGYVTTGWERYFLALGGAALLAGLVGWQRGERWGRLVTLWGAWAGALFLLLAGRRLGLPETWLINLNSMYITLFFPLAVGLGAAADRLLRGLAGRPWWGQWMGYAGAGALTAAAALFGLGYQVSMVNETTVLARPADEPAIAWVAAHTPSDAKIAVNSWQWLGATWAAQDGGAWLLPLTGRRVTTPPVDYIYNLSLFQEVIAFNEEAARIEDWTAPTATAFLRRAGVTHLFLGQRGGFLDAAELLRNPDLKLLYSQDGVFILGLTP